MTKPKIGILGGTFNPVHRGHVEVGLAVLREFGLDRVLYVLSAHPPHKRARRIPDARLRYRMLQKALLPHDPLLLPCDIEISRPGPSYTVTTLRQLQVETPGTRFYFISGSEGFLKIRTWRDYRRVLRMVCFVIVIRRPSHLQPVISLLEAEGIPWRHGPAAATRPPMAFFFQYRSSTLPLSSTQIRRRVKEGKPIGHLVAPPVGKIVEVNGLYETE